MKRNASRLVLTTEEVHRIVAQFLLEECQKQFFLAHRLPTIEDDMVALLVKQNKSQLPPALLELVNNTTWWRRVKVAIEDCGLNHFGLLQALKNPNEFINQ